MPKLLPKIYEFSHQYAFLLHDILVNIIVSGEKQGIFNVKYEIDTNHIDIPNNLSGDDLWIWLKTNGHDHIIRDFSYKQSIIALLSDFCHFIYEALQCSSKGKLTVSFALLRKPLKENLFFLELLLADPEGYLDKFHNIGPNALAIDKIDLENKKKIIKQAMLKTRYKEWVPHSFIYDLRYNKSASVSFEPLCQKATHLITTMNNNILTENENINFIFSDIEAKNNQWDFFYKYLPLLLFYVVEIVETLINEISKSENDLIMDIKKYIGFILWIDKNHQKDIMGQQFLKPVKSIFKIFDLKCPICSSNLKISKSNLINFYFNSNFQCTRCKTKIDLNETVLNFKSN